MARDVLITARILSFRIPMISSKPSPCNLLLARVRHITPLRRSLSTYDTAHCDSVHAALFRGVAAKSSGICGVKVAGPVVETHSGELMRAIVQLDRSGSMIINS